MVFTAQVALEHWEIGYEPNSTHKDLSFCWCITYKCRYDFITCVVWDEFAIWPSLRPVKGKKVAESDLNPAGYLSAVKM